MHACRLAPGALCDRLIAPLRRRLAERGISTGPASLTEPGAGPKDLAELGSCVSLSACLLEFMLKAAILQSLTGPAAYEGVGRWLISSGAFDGTAIGMGCVRIRLPGKADSMAACNVITSMILQSTSA